MPSWPPRPWRSLRAPPWPSVADADCPSPSPTTTRAVKLNRRPPLTTLATRLMVTTARRTGSSSRAASRRPPVATTVAALAARRRSAPGLRCLDAGVRASDLPISDVPFWFTVQAALTGAIGDRRDPSVVLVATAVEDDRVDPGCTSPLGDKARRPTYWPWRSCRRPGPHRSASIVGPRRAWCPPRRRRPGRRRAATGATRRGPGSGPETADPTGSARPHLTTDSGGSLALAALDGLPPWLTSPAFPTLRRMTSPA